MNEIKPVAWLSLCLFGLYKGQYEVEENKPENGPFNQSWSDWFPVYTEPQLTTREKALRAALEDLTSWFDGGPTRWGPWIIEAGEYGADAAVESARAILEAMNDN